MQEYTYKELTSSSSSSSSSSPAEVNKEALAKIERKIARLKEEESAAEGAYREQVGVLSSLQEAYYKESMPRVMDDFQRAYASRLTVMRDALKAYASETEAAHKVVLPAMEDFLGKVAQLDPQAEIEEFVTKTQTFFTVPAPPAFEPYVRAPEGVPPPGYVPLSEKSLWSRLHKKSDSRRNNPNNIYISAPHHPQDQGQTQGQGQTQQAAQKRSAGLFGVSLEQLLEQQKATMPELRVPAVVAFLADTIIQLDGQSTENVFRASGSLSSIEKEKAKINAGEFVIPTDITDSTTIFKMFFRSLPEPLIPLSL